MTPPKARSTGPPCLQPIVPAPRASVLQIMMSFWRVLRVPSTSRSRFLVAFTIRSRPILILYSSHLAVGPPNPSHQLDPLHWFYLHHLFPLHITFLARSCSSWFWRTSCSFYFSVATALVLVSPLLLRINFLISVLIFMFSPSSSSCKLLSGEPS